VLAWCRNASASAGAAALLIRAPACKRPAARKRAPQLQGAQELAPEDHARRPHRSGPGRSSPGRRLPCGCRLDPGPVPGGRAALHRTTGRPTPRGPRRARPRGRRWPSPSLRIGTRLHLAGPSCYRDGADLHHVVGQATAIVHQHGHVIAFRQQPVLARCHRRGKDKMLEVGAKGKGSVHLAWFASFASCRIIAHPSRAALPG
jgi:hypothetical protein